MTMPLPDDGQLTRLAGAAAFGRGLGYHADDRIALKQVTDTSLSGEAHGTETYGVWLKRKGAEWTWHCDCPAADDGAFCKHLVAAVLTARDEDGGDQVAEPGTTARAAKRAARQPNELLIFLRAQPAARLAGWLHDLALEDRDVEKRLLLYRAAEQPDALKTVLGKLLNTGGFLDYRRALQYANRLDEAIEPLRGALARDPAECRALCEYVLKRLIKVYGNADDSAGAIGECLHEIAALHAEACVAKPPGKPLAKALHTLKYSEDWGLFPLARYWDALGAAGQADYTKRVLGEFEDLPPPNPDNRFGDSFGVCHRTEELARCAQDFELLQRVLRRDLSHSWDHLRVLKSLREFGHEREALAWAEAAVKKFPDDDRLRVPLAECLAEAGMKEEALEQAWQCFVRHAVDEHWDALKRMAGNDWQAWRERALKAVQVHEDKHMKGVLSTRITLLMHDGDLETALQLARNNPVELHGLLELAASVKRSNPPAAGSFYLRAARVTTEAINRTSDYKRLVAYLKEASKLLLASEWQSVVVTVREQHRRKPKLMGMLDKAGL